MTAAELAGTLGVDASVVSKIENGKRRVSGFELAVIAEETGETVRRLMGMPDKHAKLAMSARLGTSMKSGPARQRAQELLELDDLADELGLPLRAGAHTGGFQGGALSGAEAAAKLRSELGRGIMGIGDLVGLCESEFGLDVATDDLGAGTGLLVRCGDEVALVVLNSKNVFARQRWTLAHELAHHIFADPNETIIEDADEPGSSPQERRADEFAIHLLMPEAGVRRVLGDGPVSIAGIVACMVEFGASREALLNRLRALKLITVAERDEWMGCDVQSMFSAAGRTSDHAAWNPQREPLRVPARIERRLLDGYKAGRIGLQPLSQLTRTAPAELRERLEKLGVVPVYAEPEPVLDLL